MLFRILLVCLLTVVCPFISGVAQAAPLHILLTNDDGYDSAGLLALKQALSKDGHRVSVIAPSGQRSGSGMKITLGDISVTQHAEDTWAVDASPADTVSFGLKQILLSERPDLVVSGANFGQNLGSNAFSSGTVGGAMMAVLNGVPAVAVSVEIKLDELASKPHRFPSTLAVFDDVGEFVRQLVGQLSADDGIKLEAGQVLNVNYPARTRAQLAGIRWARASSRGGFDLVYPSSDDGRFKSWLKADTQAAAERDTDTGNFARGFVTLTLLRPDWNVPETEQVLMRKRLGELSLAQ